jgi:hypothetical protein
MELLSQCFRSWQNPPLSSYYMALATTFLRWSGLAMHGAFLVSAAQIASSWKAGVTADHVRLNGTEDDLDVSGI